MLMRKAAAVVLAVGVLGAGAYWWSRTRSPEYSLKQVTKAVQTHDLALFETYVDLDHVAESAADAMAAGAPLGAGSTTDAPEDADPRQGRRPLGRGLAAATRPQIVATIKARLREAVEKGPRRKRDLTFVGAEGVRREGSVASATLRYNGEKGRAVRLDVRMHDMGRYWRIIELTNAADLLKRLRRE